jgi:arabinan endo-1,5-alpha-L-arabinosidase
MPSLHWTNPIIGASGPDPFIYRAEGRYWLVTTGEAADGRYPSHLAFRGSGDVDLRARRGGAGGEGAWNLFNFWAPEVLIHEGRYWLYYTAKNVEDDKNHSNRIGLAVSDRPEGPFEDRVSLVNHASLDASPFRDADGTLWLLLCDRIWQRARARARPHLGGPVAGPGPRGGSGRVLGRKSTSGRRVR